MSEAHAVSASEPTELLSWQEICRLYPDQWVALDRDRLGGRRRSACGTRCRTWATSLAFDTAASETHIVPELIDDLGYSPRQGEAITSVSSALGKARRQPGDALDVLCRGRRGLSIPECLGDPAHPRLPIDQFGVPADPGRVGLISSSAFTLTAGPLGTMSGTLDLEFVPRS